MLVRVLLGFPWLPLGFPLVPLGNGTWYRNVSFRLAAHFRGCLHAFSSACLLAQGGRKHAPPPAMGGKVAAAPTVLWVSVSVSVSVSCISVSVILSVSCVALLL